MSVITAVQWMGLQLTEQVNWSPAHWTAMITLNILSNRCTCCSLLPQLQPPPPPVLPPPPPPQPHMVDTLKSIPTVGMNQPMRELVWCLADRHGRTALYWHGPHHSHSDVGSIPRSTVDCNYTTFRSRRSLSGTKQFCT